MRKSKLTRLMILAFVSAFTFSSCEDEETKKIADCNERATTYNTNLQSFNDFLNSEEDPSCDEFKAEWNALSSSYADLCDESKTTEVEEGFVEVEVVVEFYAALTECEL